jgi:hypothetical protein
MKKIPKPLLKKLSEPSEKKRVLHLYSGAVSEKRMHASFTPVGWEEVRVDPFAENAPDIVGGFDALSQFPDDCFQAIWCAHRLQLLPQDQVVPSLKACLRVLSDKGMLLFTTADLQTVSKLVWESKQPDEPLTSKGPTALQLLYGPSSALRFQSSFTALTFGRALKNAGFYNVEVKREDLTLWGLGHKLSQAHPNRSDRILVVDRYAPMQPSTAPGMSDELDRPPHLWKPVGLKKA